MKRYNAKWIYIDFLCRSKSGKTNIYQVMSREGVHLGDIRWYASWRRYAFFPEINSIYEMDCLRDIAQFLATLKQERKESV